jgi:hypothetical protein
METPETAVQDSALHPPLLEGEFLETRKAEGEALLRKLPAAERVPFNTKLLSLLPREHGLYAIAYKGAPSCEFLRAGKSDTGKDGLQGRIWKQHYQTGGSRGDLIERVKDEKGLDPRGAKKWIEDNCEVQWVEVPDKNVRNWVEHYVLAILRPIWCR